MQTGAGRPAPDAPPFDFLDESQAVQLSGRAGDILVFCSELVHGGCRNPGGQRRRSFLAGYFAETLRASHQQTAALRGVRMDTSPRFDPADHALDGAAWCSG